MSARQSPSSQSRLSDQSRKVGRQQEARPEGTEARDGGGDVLKTEMHEAIPAQDEIGARQLIARDVGNRKTSLQLAPPGSLCVGRDQ